LTNAKKCGATSILINKAYRFGVAEQTFKGKEESGIHAHRERRKISKNEIENESNSITAHEIFNINID
jgi:hypothetical protein